MESTRGDSMKCPRCGIEMKVNVSGELLTFICRNRQCSGYGQAQAEKDLSMEGKEERHED